MTSPVSGWYPDPHGQPGERFWDGASWTDHTRAVPAPPVVDAPPAYDGYGNPAPQPFGAQQPFGSPPPYAGGSQPQGPQQPYGSPPPYAGGPQYGGGQQYGAGEQFTPPATNPAKNFLARNPLSFATVGVTVAYLLILVFAHVAILGILPLLLGFRAVSRKEPLAVAAVVIGVLAFILGIYEYARR